MIGLLRRPGAAEYYRLAGLDPEVQDEKETRASGSWRPSSTRPRNRNAFALKAPVGATGRGTLNHVPLSTVEVLLLVGRGNCLRS
jgi:hypothetical protein